MHSIHALADAIGQLPPQYQEHLVPHLQRIEASYTRRQRILTLVQEALAQLRLDMKYLMFDLHATRQERDRYKAQLEQH